MLVCLYRMESGQRSGQKESWGFTTRSGQATRQIHLGEKAPTNDIHCPPLYAWLLRGTWHVTVSAVRQRVWWILHLEAGGCLCQRKRSHHSWAPVPFWWSHSSDSWSEAETSNERLGEVHVRKMMTVDNASQQLFLNFNKQSWVFPALSRSNATPGRPLQSRTSPRPLVLFFQLEYHEKPNRSLNSSTTRETELYFWAYIFVNSFLERALLILCRANYILSINGSR